MFWARKVTKGGAKENLRDREADLLSSDGDGMLSNNRDNCQVFKVYREGKGGDIFPEGISPRWTIDGNSPFSISTE